MTENTKNLCKMVALDGSRIGLAWSSTVKKRCAVQDLAQLGLDINNLNRYVMSNMSNHRIYKFDGLTNST